MKKIARLAGVAAVCVPSFAFAQEAEDAGTSSGGLTEIIVTATKRSESLQDVPVSVLAASGESIEQMAVGDLNQLTANMPAVTIGQSPIGSFIFIRGIGTPGVNQGLEQSVSMFRDGVFAGRPQQSRAPIMDVERVEVLRGPQSILFGKNTIGGAINIIDRKPTDYVEGRVSALVGSHGERELNAMVSGPLADGLSGRVSFRGYNIDGWLDNVITGEKASSSKDWTVRTQLQFEPTDNLTINAKWEHSEFNRGEQSTQLAITNPFNANAVAFSGLNQALVAFATGGNGVEAVDGTRAVDNDGGIALGTVAPIFAGLPGFPDIPEFSNNRLDSGTLTMVVDLGGPTLTMVSNYSSYKYRDICDCDFAAVPLIQVDAREKYRQYTQEIRLTSEQGLPVEYIVGAYYHNAKIDFNSIESFGSAMAYTLLGLPTPLLLPNLTRDYTLDQKQKMWAVFGQATWNVSDTTRAIVGLRYFEDRKNAMHILDKRFTDGWDYSALIAAPAGTLAYGNTAADYDAFLAGFGTTNIGGGVTPGFLTEAVYASLLGTSEHNRLDSRKETKLNWTVTLQQDINPDVMVYGTVATGTKGGGYDARFLGRDPSDPLYDVANDYFSYGPENAISYEVGLKSTLFNNRLRFNLAAFLVTVKDFQVSIFDGATAFLVVNAGKARSKGVEFDVTWAATDNLTFNASGSLMDAKWASFPNAPCWASPASPLRGNCVNFGTPAAYRDATGEQLTFAPDFSANFGFTYDQPLTDTLGLSLGATLVHSTSYFNAADLDPIYAVQKGYDKIDARIAFGHLDGKWEIAFIGKNLTNERISYNNNDQPLVPGNGFTQTDRTRSYAVQASVNF
ncbi:MAG: TonB-dependent receptor [Sphingomonadaceae bacterium]